jgi:hypothetical protein
MKRRDNCPVGGEPCQSLCADPCRWDSPRQNPPMPQSTAERQRAFKEAMKEAGFVRLEAYVTREQREKFRQIGGDDWLRKKIDSAARRPPMKEQK